MGNNRTVTNAGDFKWKPEYIIEHTVEFPMNESTNGLGVTQVVTLASTPNRQWTLNFKSSKPTYDAIKNFLLSKKYGGKSFTWYFHDEATMYTVRQATGGFNLSLTTDNTLDQETQAVEFSVTLIEVK